MGSTRVEQHGGHVGEVPRRDGRSPWFDSSRAKLYHIDVYKRQHHGFAIGSFVDELARATGKDTGQFLLDLIGSDRQVDLSKGALVEPPPNYYGGAWTDFPTDTVRAKNVLRLAMQRSNCCLLYTSRCV